jgi:2',3'-cyclic-nucleotide 2'-phosphodiesterase (5'-nucleotidase family)
MNLKSLLHKKMFSLLVLGLLTGSSVVGQTSEFKNIANIQVGEEAAAEIVTYSKATQELWVLNSPNKTVDVYDFSNPNAPTLIYQFDFSGYGDAATSVAAKGNYIAIAVKPEITQDNGKIILLNAETYEVLKDFETGALPDMVTFTPDGTKILSANEGEPNADYDNDPMGSVTIVDLSEGVDFAQVTSTTFSAYNDKKAYLRGIGVRIQENAGQTVAQDLEPEYISISEDGTTAFVTLQENNAVAKVDIATKMITDILPLGYKDYMSGTPILKEYVLNDVNNWPELGTPVYANNQGSVMLGGFSGLCYDQFESTETTAVFWTVPDRGPNLDPISGVTGAAGSLRPYKLPDYQARLVKFSVNLESGVVSFNPTDQKLLTAKDGTTPISGKGNVEGVDEVPVTLVDNSVDADYTVDGVFYKELTYDPMGGDFEGVIRDKNGKFWLCDENRPGIYKFDVNGQLIERYVPHGISDLGTTAQDSGYYGAETLPANYNNRRSNRGFEGIAYDSINNIIYAFIQSAMYNPGSDAKNSDVIRILGVSADDGTPVSEYVYLIERNANKGTVSSVTDKIGDACYVGNNKFVVIERDSKGLGDKGSKKYIFEIDLLGATNILNIDIARLSSGTTLELLSADQIVEAGIQPVFKRKVVNLPSIGYLPSDKAEGLAALPNGQFAVINDNDFGLAGAGQTDNSVLGIVSFSNNYKITASDKVANPDFAHAPVLGALMPDAIGTYVFDGMTYFVTANEGDGREYGDFADETRIAKLDLNEAVYGNVDSLQDNNVLGRLKSIACPTWEDLDNDGKNDRIFVEGGRSFSIFDEFGNLVYDSGTDLVDQVFKYDPKAINVYLERADDKGTEPEALAIGSVGDRTLAFIGLERLNAIVIYDVTDPLHVEFVHYINDYNFYNESGNESPEGFTFIAAEDSPNGNAILIAGYETSGTMAVYSNQEYTTNASFMVISDVHYMDSSLLIQDGTAFQTYLAGDRKMLKESPAILSATIDTIIAMQPAFVLVPGDLTKDGEKISHQGVASYFAKLEAAGIDVFVAPGNHDINNPHAVAFNGDDTEEVASVTPAEFASIYNDYGYNQAYSRDSASLSYAVEMDNLILIAVDVCHYDNNYVDNYPETAGSLNDTTFVWILDRLAEADAKGKEIIAMQHHGMLEHYSLHEEFLPEYVIENWETISRKLADAGMHVVFTGHSHAQDITKKITDNGNVIFDIETGSTVTYPCPFRYCELLSDGTLLVDGGKVSNVDLGSSVTVPFEQYAQNFLESGFPVLIKYMLMNQYGLSEEAATPLIEPATNAFLAHYYGDEQNPSEADQAIIDYLMGSEDALNQMFGAFLNSLWTDLPTADWNVTLDLHEKHEAKTFAFTIFHNNDGESKLVDAGSGLENYGGVARFKTLIDSLRNDLDNDYVTLSSGDNFLAGAVFNAGLNHEAGIFDALAMSAINYDAICLGNHDFDFGPDVLAKFINDFTTQVPFLSCNLGFTNEDTLLSLLNNGRIASSTIITKGDITIGVIGATTPALSYISSPRNVSIGQAVADSVQAEVNNLLANDVNKIILISHLQDITEDTTLIKALTGVDVVIAGGGDELLGSDPSTVIDTDLPFFGAYPLSITDKAGDTVYVVTTPGEYKYVGKLDITFNPDGEVIALGNKSGLYVVTSEVASDSALQVLVDSINSDLDAYESNVIASSEVALDGTRNNVRAVETNLGNLVADAMLWQANQLSQSFGVKTAEVAFVNAGGIRNNSIIPVGNLNELHTFEILPFSNFVSIIEDVSPATLKEALENSVSAMKDGLNSGDGRFLQVAGLKMQWDTVATSIAYDTDGNIINGNTGSRIWSIKLANQDSTEIVKEGELVSGAPKVTIATTNFTAAGGDQHPFGSYSFTTLGVTYQQALYNYLVEGLSGSVTAAMYSEGGEGRIMYKYVTIGVPDALLEANVKLYPNPASAQITVDANANGSIAVYNLSGSIVLHEPILSGTTVLNISGLQAGIYVYTVTTQNGITQNKLIVK